MLLLFLRNHGTDGTPVTPFSANGPLRVRVGHVVRARPAHSVRVDVGHKIRVVDRT